MGISGLLPALKAIHTTKHLSEYSGKTIAVDAYVWLHKGVYSCATELATGKSTHKYVDYAMHRVRLMRHYRIEPYIVFDGGPLPAKKGTEKERKQKREENLARGKALAAQGKHSQARDCFIKCVDVTPQMAFQFIKALRAESVRYVVAPYEADAQLAYLERVGVVDGILTEDSDLLVFGCQTVLFKLDAVASTVVSISRKDFGSVTASSSDPNGISLIGWSDVQFRAMTILSGCDYLPSIPGVGLKTACFLLRKWKTAEQVVRAIALEGKKSVPPGYWKQFQLAEKCFLHQRVYCPKAEKLVHLTDISDDWNDDFDVYVGGDMDPVLAMDIALGDADPVSHLPMKDINPGFVPRALKPLPTVSNSPVKSLKGKGKMRESLPPGGKTREQNPPPGGILSFFGPNPIIPPRSKQKKPVSTAVAKHGLTGKASGKRTLAEVMDQDMERKKKSRKSCSPLPFTRSKFFAPPEVKATGVQRRHSDGVAGPSRLQDDNKENMYVVVDDDDDPAETSEPDLDGSDLSLRAHFDVDAEMNLDLEEFPDAVEQEDGYISPSPSYSKEAQELSSPPQPGQSSRSRRRQWNDSGTREDDEMGQTEGLPSDKEEEENSFGGAEAVSSPISVKRPKPFGRRNAYQTPPRWSRNEDSGGDILVVPTPTPTNRKGIYPDVDEVPSPTLYRGPDLRNLLGADSATEIEFEVLELEEKPFTARGGSASGSGSASASPPNPSPETPNDDPQLQQQVVDIDVDNFDGLNDEEEQRAREVAARAKAVMNGWRDRWALQPKKASPLVSVQPKKSPVRGAPQKKTFTPGPQAFNLRRNEMNVTPAGRHSLSNLPRSAPSKFSVVGAAADSEKSITKPRRNLLFFEAVKHTTATTTTTTAVATASSRTRQIVDLTLSSDGFEEAFGVAPKRPKSAVLSE